MVCTGYGIYEFVRLYSLNGGLIVFFSFLLLYGLIQHGGSASNEEDKLMAWLHMMCPGLGITRIIHSQLASSPRSSAIFLPSLPLTTQQFWHLHLQQYLLSYIHTRPYTAVCLYNKIKNNFHILPCLDTWFNFNISIFDLTNHSTPYTYPPMYIGKWLLNWIEYLSSYPAMFCWIPVMSM